MEFKKPSARSQEVAQHVQNVLGDGSARIRTHWTEGNRSSVYILQALDQPFDGWTTYSTLDLNESRNIVDGRNMPVELLGVIEGRNDDFANAIATVAANCQNDALELAPGVVHPRVLELYDGLAPGLPHAFLTSPMDALAPLATMHCIDGPVQGLQLVPISEGEFRCYLENGGEALAQQLRRSQVAYWDLNRPSLFHPRQFERSSQFTATSSIGTRIFNMLGVERVDLIEYAAGNARLSMLRADDSPQPGLTSYVTVNLHETRLQVGDQRSRVELLGITRGHQDSFADALGGVAVECMNGTNLQAGMVFEKALRDYPDVSKALPHLLVTRPLVFASRFQRLSHQPTVEGLQVIPITQPELNFMRNNGFTALELLLSQSGLAYADLHRRSLI